VKLIATIGTSRRSSPPPKRARPSRPVLVLSIPVGVCRAANTGCRGGQPCVGDNAAMELRRERVTAELLDPRVGFERVRLPLEIRWDPLTGQSCRLLLERAAALAGSDRPHAGEGRGARMGVLCVEVPERVSEQSSQGTARAPRHDRPSSPEDGRAGSDRDGRGRRGRSYRLRRSPR